VKIKITEYFPTAGVLEDVAISEDMLHDMHSMFPLQGNSAFNVLSAPSGSSLPENHPGANGRRYFTIQRVNGTGTQGNGLGCGHQHSLEDSDRVKKNSVQRILLKEDKERKKSVVGFSLLILVEAHAWMEKTGVGLASPQDLPLRHGQDRLHATLLVTPSLARESELSFRDFLFSFQDYFKGVLTRSAEQEHVRTEVLSHQGDRPSRCHCG